MAMHKHHKERAQNQEGFAAIVVAVVLVVVLGLITVGFAKLMRSEQTSSFDRQLSTEAFYAAESGVNDAIKVIEDAVASNNLSGADKTGCGPLPTGPLSNNQLAPAVSYSCLLIDLAPPNLEYGSIGYQAKVLQLTGIADDGVTKVPITKLRISWQDPKGRVTSSDFAAYNSPTVFPQADKWTSYTGILRTEVVGLDNLDRTALIDNAYDAFLFPNAGSVGAIQSSSYAAQVGQWDKKGEIVPGNCNSGKATPHACAVDIVNIDKATSSHSLLLVLQSLYTDSQVDIVGYGPAGSPIRLQGGQALIDSTGKASDVLRRLQVRIPVNSGFYPANAIDAAGVLCKKFNVAPGVIPDDACPGPTNVIYTALLGTGGKGGGNGGGGGKGGGGGGPPVDPTQNWSRFFTNESADSTAPCSWSYQLLPNGQQVTYANDKACSAGQGLKIDFPVGDPSYCHTYRVFLKVTFPDGTTDTATQDVQVPHKTTGGQTCG